MTGYTPLPVSNPVIKKKEKCGTQRSTSTPPSYHLLVAPEDSEGERGAADWESWYLQHTRHLLQNKKTEGTLSE